MLIEQIKKDFMEARKEAVKTKDNTKSAFLSILVSEIEKIGKDNGNRQTTDEEAMKVVRKFIKNAEETISVGEKSGKDVSTSKQEVAILNSYLPKQMTEDQLKLAIIEIVNSLSDKNPKMMGKVMGELKAKYDGQYDNKLASQLVKSSLN
jgi:uncharacterized protein YqeY